MAITQSAIAALMGRFNNKYVVEQANEACRIRGEGILTEIFEPSRVGVINVKAGEAPSSGWVADGGALFTGDHVDFQQATYNLKPLFGRLSIPRMAADMATGGEDGINLVLEQMKSVGADLGRKLGRGLFTGDLGSPTSAVTANTDTTFTVKSASGWRAGMAFEVYNGSSAVEGHTEATRLQVTNVAINADPSLGATITFVGSGTGGAAASSWTTSYTLYVRGAKTSGTITSFGDVTAAASLFGVSNAIAEWSGNLDSTTTTLSIPAMDNLATLHARRRGQPFTHVLVNSVNEQRYAELMINNRRFVSGKMDAVGGETLEYKGRPVFVDENIDDSDLFLFTQGDIKLHVAREFAPYVDGGKSAGMTVAASIVGQTNFDYDAQIAGYFQLRPERRNGLSRMSALTA